MGIELNLTGKCEGCDGFEPKFDSLYLGLKKEWFVSCENKDLCDYFEKKFKETKNDQI